MRAKKDYGKRRCVTYRAGCVHKNTTCRVDRECSSASIPIRGRFEPRRKGISLCAICSSRPTGHCASSYANDAAANPSTVPAKRPPTSFDCRMQLQVGLPILLEGMQTFSKVYTKVLGLWTFKKFSSYKCQDHLFK